MTAHAARARSIYRSILRELPRRPLAEPSPLKADIRRQFTEAPGEAPTTHVQAMQQAEQFVAYARAQRTYSALVERYNPGLSMDEEERVRLTMRRVGLNAPTEWKGEQ